MGKITINGDFPELCKVIRGYQVITCFSARIQLLWLCRRLGLVADSVGVKEVGQKVRSYGDADEIHIIFLLVMIHNYIIIMQYVFIYIYIYTYIYIHVYIYIVWGIQPSFSFNCIGIPTAEIPSFRTGWNHAVNSKPRPRWAYVRVTVVGSIKKWEVMLFNNQCYILWLIYSYYNYCYYCYYHYVWWILVVLDSFSWLVYRFFWLQVSFFRGALIFVSPVACQKRPLFVIGCHGEQLLRYQRRGGRWGGPGNDVWNDDLMGSNQLEIGISYGKS